MSTQLDVAISLLRSVLGNQKAVYLSCPITTGRYFYEQLPDYYTANKRKAIVVANELRNAGAFGDKRTIEPAYFSVVPGWTWQDYMDMWRRVIEECVDTVVFVNGWEYSDGCVDEFTHATVHRKATFDEDMVIIECERTCPDENGQMSKLVVRHRISVRELFLTKCFESIIRETLRRIHAQLDAVQGGRGFSTDC